MSQENYTTESRKSKHLNYEERKIIERLLENNVAKKAIARLLCRDINTIRDEIKRGSVEQRKRNNYVSRNPKVPEYFTYTKYFADVGQRNYEKARLNCGAKCKIIECRPYEGIIFKCHSLSLNLNYLFLISFIFRIEV